MPTPTSPNSVELQLHEQNLSFAILDTRGEFLNRDGLLMSDCTAEFSSHAREMYTAVVFIDYSEALKYIWPATGAQ